jgi:hypothetical protein
MSAYQPNPATEAWKVSRLLDANHAPEFDAMNATCTICGYLAESISNDGHLHLINPDNINEARA